MRLSHRPLPSQTRGVFSATRPINACCCHYHRSAFRRHFHIYPGRLRPVKRSLLTSYKGSAGGAGPAGAAGPGWRSYMYQSYFGCPAVDGSGSGPAGAAGPGWRSYINQNHFGCRNQSTKTHSDLLEQSLDLRAPASWYPLARQRPRRVIFHAGPTNSGKTHAALKALCAAPTGVYCGPLRLLAWEIYSRLNADGTPCGLRTGQETKDVEGAAHVSCTVEMADTDIRYAVGVLDEIQMLADETRGWAWTRALLGLVVDELHCCGDPAAAPLLARLCEMAGDTFEVLEYERLSPLEISGQAVRELEGIRDGDCVVAFSRRQLYTLRAQIELASAGEIQCGLVYGRLPADARRGQAAWFNNSHEHDEQRALVATDAIGMGLNLNIKRVIFTTLEKYDGKRRRRLTSAEIKQIAGRAGRYGSEHAHGQVTCLRPEDMHYLQEALASPPEPLTRAGLAPTSEQLLQFVSLRTPPSWVSPAVTLDDDNDDDEEEEQEGEEASEQDEEDTDFDEEDAVFQQVMATDPAAYDFVRRHGDRSFDDISERGFDEDEHDYDEEDGFDDFDRRPERYSHATGSWSGGADEDNYDRDYIDSLFDDVDDSEQYQYDEDSYDEADSSYLGLELPRYYSHSPDDRGVLFSVLLEDYFRSVRVNQSLFFVSNASDMYRVAEIIDDIPMPLHNRYTFALAPVESQEPFAVAMLHRFASHFSNGGWVDLGLDLTNTDADDDDDDVIDDGAQKRKKMSDRARKVPRSPGQLHELEVVHSVIDSYLWLATRFETEFCDVDAANDQARLVQELIELGIKALAVDPTAIRNAYRNKAGAKRLESILRATSALPKRRKHEQRRRQERKQGKSPHKDKTEPRTRRGWDDDHWDPYPDAHNLNVQRSSIGRNKRPKRRTRVGSGGAKKSRGSGRARYRG